MMKKLILFSVLCFLIQEASAQYMRGTIKHKYSYAAVYGNVGYDGNPHYGGGMNIQYTWGIGRKRQRFNVGFGLRANVFFTKKRYYSTSSPELIAQNPGGADSLYFNKIQTNTLNGYFVAQFNIKPGVDIYFTTDIGGINFGDGRKGEFLSYETNPVFTAAGEYNTEPYAFNLNIPINNSYGSLLTEVYGQFRVNETISWRLGVSHLRSEYVTTVDVPRNGRRFSQGHYMATAGLAFNLRKGLASYDHYFRDK